MNKVILKETKPSEALSTKSGAYREVLQHVHVREAVIFAAFYWGIMATILYCLVPLMLQKLGFNAFGTVLAATNLLCFFGAKPAAELSDRLGRKAVLLPSMSFVALAALLLPSVFSAQRHEAALLTLFLGALAIGQALVGPALPAIFTDRLKPKLHTEALSLLWISTEVGAVTLSLSMSFMVGSLGFTVPLMLAGVAALASALRFSRRYP